MHGQHTVLELSGDPALVDLTRNGQPPEEPAVLPLQTVEVPRLVTLLLAPFPLNGQHPVLDPES